MKYNRQNKTSDFVKQNVQKKTESNLNEKVAFLIYF